MFRPIRVPRQVGLLFVMMLLTFGCGETSMPTGPSLSSPAGGSVGFSTPAATPRAEADTPLLTIADVAASLAQETNTSFDAALRASLGIASLEPARPETYFASLLNLLLPTPVYAQTFGGFAPCKTAGSVRISGDATPSGRRVSLRGVQVSYSTCSYPLGGPTNNRSVTFSGSMTVNGTWSADEANNPVTMTGSLDVNDIGPVEISCTSLSTEAGCNGNVGGITTGSPDTAPPPNPTPAPCTINGVPVECPAPVPTPAPTPGGINVTGTWVAPGQPGSLVLTQSGTAITGTAILPPVPNTTIVTNSITGTIVGNTVNLVHVMSLRVVSGPVTVVSAGNTNYSFQATSSSTMSGTGTTTVTVTATCAGEFCPPPTTNTTTTTQSLTITKQ